MICLSLYARDYAECKKVLSDYSFVEFRLDNTDFNLNEIKDLFSSSNKTIATCREGKFTENERLDILKTTIQSGASYVDIDFSSRNNFKNTITNYIKNTDCKLILSYHNFNETPTDKELISIIEKMKMTKADIYKIATKVNEDSELIRLFSLYKHYEKGKLMVFGMGKKGRISRIVAEFLGSPFTYASLDKTKSTAPGQIDFQSLKQIMDLLSE